MPSATVYFASTDLMPASLKWRIELLVPPSTSPQYETRGEDIVVPALSGRVVASSGARVADRLLINADFWILGQGSTPTAEREDFKSSWDTLGAIFDPKLNPAALVVYGATQGVPSGKKRTLNARFLNLLPVEGIPGLAQKFSLQFECVDSPPVWVETNNP
jgi:hypothetical protein